MPATLHSSVQDKTCQGIELLTCSNEDIHGISIVFNSGGGFHHSYISNVFLLFFNNDSYDVYSAYSFFFEQFLFLHWF